VVVVVAGVVAGVTWLSLLFARITMPAMTAALPTI
jgi:hypothetical protein